MTRQLKPARGIGGTITVPGDKSIAHRAVLLSILSHGPIQIKNFPDNADCLSSLNAVQKFGVKVERSGSEMTLTPPEAPQITEDTIIDCGNSGTTVRLLAGIVAGSSLSVVLSGDGSLSTRPMKRIVDPLSAMGADIYATEDHLPLTVRGKQLLPFEYLMPVASAQVKSAVLFAGLASGCSTIVREEVITRDHTELMLRCLGEGLTVRDIKPVPEPDPVDPRKKRMVMPESFKKEITLAPKSRINGGVVDIPGDFSTAAYFMAAAAIARRSITTTNVGLNPTRTAFIDYLKNVGCKVEISDKAVISGEPRGTVTVTGESLKQRKISGDTTVGLIDEIPIVSVVAAFTEGTTVIRDATELRVKESDRLAAIAENLTRMGVNVGLLEDGLAIEGKKELNGSDFVSFGDHRIAMAFSIASLFTVGPSTIDDDSVVSISCPNFYEILDSIRS